MKIFDLAVSYTWIYDSDFVNFIEEVFQKEGLSTFLIQDHNISEVTQLVSEEKIIFKAYLDRASDLDAKYDELATILTQKNVFMINPHSVVESAINKSAIHYKLINNGFIVPNSIIVPSYNESTSLNISDEDLSKIGKPFIIKPSLDTGGGEGVILNAKSLEDIQQERQKYPYEVYLIQEIVRPKLIMGKRAWFRVFWFFDKAIPTWWDDKVHVYNLINDEERTNYNLIKLEEIATKLASLVKLDYFSTEIALTEKGDFVLVDYINDQCDMRLKSKHKDGVPDELVKEFIIRMKNKISSLQ
ncbi:RimK family alpha-L-glutamate ligase [Melioribacteraceae bacterium 4301-Me]|uniref:ATP-grasp domain-containing protein n=1 Tax=Pyranulibacter aquaticus TaxID=3163344 RepID=UPI0035983B2F